MRVASVDMGVPMEEFPKARSQGDAEVRVCVHQEGWATLIRYPKIEPTMNRQTQGGRRTRRS